MLRIRLTRMGAKKKPFYRVIIKERRSKRDGKYLENLGTYNPMTDPPEVKLNHERIEYWISKGAKPTETVTSLIKYNPRISAEELDNLEKVSKGKTEEAVTKKEAGSKDKKADENSEKSSTKERKAEKAVPEKAGGAEKPPVKVEEVSVKKEEKLKNAAVAEKSSVNEGNSENPSKTDTKERKAEKAVPEKAGGAEKPPVKVEEVSVKKEEKLKNAAVAEKSSVNEGNSENPSKTENALAGNEKVVIKEEAKKEKAES